MSSDDASPELEVSPPSSTPSSFFSAKAGSRSSVSTPKELPWIEKYRPKTVDEISHQEEVVKTLKKSMETGNLPHLLFYGPPGTGKTSTILAIAHQLYGPELFRKSVLELNASDDRGIDVVRERVKRFAQTVTAVASSAAYKRQYPCPPYKLIILDEADSMTSEAQAALRRVIENYSKTTRFCLICNYVSRIIDPLASRCAKFRFKPLPRQSIAQRIHFIGEKEGFSASEEILVALEVASGGDMRRAITLLQSAFRLEGPHFTPDLIIEVSGMIPEEDIKRFIDSCTSNSFDRLLNEVKRLTSQGYNCSQFLSQLSKAIIPLESLSDMKKASISIAIAEADNYLVDGADEFIQTLNVGTLMMKTLSS